MDGLNPKKLTTSFDTGVTKTQPILGRHYTLTHSDETGQLFLNVGLTFAYDKITSMRDEVLGRWKVMNGQMVLYVYVYVDGENGLKYAPRRNEIFVRELPLALEAIIYGDKKFFQAHNNLYDAPIYVYFDSMIINFNRIEYWGTVMDYT